MAIMNNHGWSKPQGYKFAKMSESESLYSCLNNLRTNRMQYIKPIYHKDSFIREAKAFQKATHRNYKVAGYILPQAKKSTFSKIKEFIKSVF